MTAEAKGLGEAVQEMITAVSKIGGRYELESHEMMGCLITLLAYSHACRVLHPQRSAAAIDALVVDIKRQAAEWLLDREVLQARYERGLGGPGQVGQA